MDIGKGLNYLGFPKTDFVLQDSPAGVYIRDWNSSKPKPTMADIEAAADKWVLEYNSQEYARKRSAEYPSIDELTVALWEGVVEERMAAVTQLEIKRQAVKAKYPK
jgi:hypothetical protein